MLLFKILKSLGFDFFASVPCSLLADLISLVEKDKTITYTPVTREEEGIGILSGAYLCGKKPVLLMQNSGLGNSINAVMSLSHFFKIPIVFIISHRGTKGEKINAQKPMGNVTKTLLKDIGVQFYQISSTKDLPVIERVLNKRGTEGKSIAFLFPFSFWQQSG